MITPRHTEIHTVSALTEYVVPYISPLIKLHSTKSLFDTRGYINHAAAAGQWAICICTSSLVQSGRVSLHGTYGSNAVSLSVRSG
jgi:hypothetical protein